MQWHVPIITIRCYAGSVCLFSLNQLGFVGTKENLSTDLTAY